MSSKASFTPWLASLCEFLERELGHKYSPVKHHELIRNFSKAAEELEFKSPEALLDRLTGTRASDDLLVKVARYLTIGETYFFRERDRFEPMMRHILTEIIGRKKMQQDRRIRIWSAGCSSGEEPYSIAMMLHHLLEDPEDWSIQILATDINREFLQKARKAVYRSWSFRGTPDWVVNRYFRSVPEGLSVDPRIRQWVTFDGLNLAGGLYPSLLTQTEAMDLIFCRNVLIYFSEAKALDVTSRLKACLRKDGYLVLSPTELSLIDPDGLIRHTRDSSIYFQKGFPTPTPSTPRPFSKSIPAFSPGNSSPQPDSKKKRVEPSPLPLHLKVHAPKKQTSDPAPQGMDQAEVLLRQGEPVAAMALLRPLEKTEKLNPGYHFLRAMVQLEEGSIPDAETSFKKVLYLDPQHPMALFTLTHLYLQQGEDSLAKRYAQQLVESLQSYPEDRKLPGSEDLYAGQLLHSVQAIFDPEPLLST